MTGIIERVLGSAVQYPGPRVLLRGRSRCKINSVKEDAGRTRHVCSHDISQTMSFLVEETKPARRL